MPVNEKSLENLRPVQKGEIRNPKGRPVGSKNFKTIIEEVLAVETEAMNPMSKQLETMSVQKQIVIAAIAKARKGDIQAIKELFDRIDGKAPQTIKHDGQVDTGAKDVALFLQKLIQDDKESKAGDTQGS